MIVFFALLLKSTLTGFYALKHLCAGFEGNTLVGNTLRAVEPGPRLAGFLPPNLLKDGPMRSDADSALSQKP
jgi:hypothetical protein